MLLHYAINCIFIWFFAVLICAQYLICIRVSLYAKQLNYNYDTLIIVNVASDLICFRLSTFNFDQGSLKRILFMLFESHRTERLLHVTGI